MEKIRIAFAGDLHADDLSPSSRKDNYLDACIDELNEALELTAKYKCKAFVHAGDVYHRIDPDGICRNRVLETFSHDRRGKPWPFEKYVVIGNHDIKHNPLYLPKSAIWTLIKAGVVKYVNEAPELGIGFEHFRSTIDEDILSGCLLEKPNVIVCAHANITIGDFFEGSTFAPINKIPLNPATKLLLAGHIHYPLEGMRPDGVKFVNPGSICRNTLQDYNRTRTPQILFVEYTLDGSHLQYKLVPLTVSKPAEEIFYLEEIDRKKEADADMSAYIQQISQFTRYSHSDKIAGLKEMAKMRQIRNEVLEKAIDKVKAVNERKGIHISD